MDAAGQLLQNAASVLVVDWPSPEVPDALARAGLVTVVSGGPEPDNYSAYELVGDDVVVRHLGRRPDHADLVFMYRPLAELPGIVAVAREIGATAVWVHSGVAPDGTKDPTGCWMPDERSGEARAVVESAGLVYVERPYIVDAARARAPEGGS